MQPCMVGTSCVRRQIVPRSVVEVAAVISCLNYSTGFRRAVDVHGHVLPRAPAQQPAVAAGALDEDLGVRGPPSGGARPGRAPG